MIIVIPARGGSKRIPNKNKKDFHGIPIIERVICNLLSMADVSRIIVSTDDPEIAIKVKKVGAETPFYRPENLSDDHTPTIEVIKHAIQQLEISNNEIVGCVYATSVFLHENLVRKVIDSVKLHPDNFSFSAREFRHPIQRSFRLQGDGRVLIDKDKNLNSRTQDCDVFFHDTGDIYAARCSIWNATNQIINDRSYAVLNEDQFHVDIDSQKDWEQAELLYEFYEFLRKKGTNIIL